MIRVAKLYADLRTQASHQWTLSILGRSLVVYARSDELATAACRSMSRWRTPALEVGSKPDEVCVVELSSRSAFQVNTAGVTASRSFQLPNVGTFLVYNLDDGSAVVQPGRGVFLCSTAGEMVWLIDDALLAQERDRWPNLTDLAIVITAEVLRRVGCFLAHAGGVGRRGRCLLLTGESGSGKTTFTVRKAMEGWDFYGDDMVIVGQDPDGRWRIHPFWRPVHLTPSTRELLGSPRMQSMGLTTSNKFQCDITELVSVIRPVPGLVEAVINLRPGWHPEMLQPLSKADALSTLGATFLSGFNPRAAEHDLENLLEFLTTTPVYQASWSSGSQAVDHLLADGRAHADDQ
ncbi:MAG TPA: hypothetical protein VL486_11055 [Verrucomicrobiae bacterium]|nr:hypothetical protein [Verrucomicrobiae bacterium]